MSGTLVLTPESVATSGEGLYGSFVASDAGDLAAALADSSDSTYIVWASGPTISATRFNMSDPPDLPAGARPYSLQAVVRANRTGAMVGALNFRIHNGNYQSGKVDWTKTSVFPFTTDTETRNGPIETTVNTREQFSQDTLNRLTLEIFGWSTAVARVYDAHINVQYDEQPVAEPLGPTGVVTDTSSPTVSWRYTDDLQPQVSYQVEVYLGGGANPPKIYSSGILNGTTSEFKLPLILDSGEYVYRVAVAQKWPYDGAPFWSAWAYSTFTIAADPFPQPQMIVTPQHGFVGLEVQHNANLLSYAEASGQHGVSEWDSHVGLYNLTPTTSAYHTSDRSMLLTLSGPAASIQRGTARIPVASGVKFRAAAFFRTSTPDSAAALCSVGIEFFDQDMNSQGFTSGAGVMENVGTEQNVWVIPYADATAPMDGFVSVRLMVNNGQAHDQHLVDDVQLWMLDDRYDQPNAGRGGLLYAQTQTSEGFAQRGWPTPGLNLFNQVDAGGDGPNSTWAPNPIVPNSVINGNDSGDSLYGLTSVSLTRSSSPGNISATRPTAARLSVTQGEKYQLVGSAKAAAGAVAHACRMVLRYFDKNAAYFTSATLTTNTTDATSAWLPFTNYSAVGSGMLGTAANGQQYFIVPEDAVSADVAIEVIGGSPAVGEKHYFDRLAWYKLDVDTPTSVDWQEGVPEADTDLGRVVIEYQETSGVDRGWHVLSKLEIDPLKPTVSIQDWDLASGVKRSYRAYTNRFYDASNINSAYSLTKDATITFTSVWLSLVGGPGYQFVYDGEETGAKQEVYDPQLVLTPIVGRDYSVTESNTSRLHSVQVTVSLLNQNDLNAWNFFVRQQRPFIYRDGRGRRMRGIPLSVTNTDEKFGGTVQFTMTAAGDQSIGEWSS